MQLNYWCAVHLKLDVGQMLKDHCPFPFDMEDHYPSPANEKHHFNTHFMAFHENLIELTAGHLD